MKKIILASSSPRRIRMMKEKGYDPVIMPADVNENLPFHMTPEASAMYLALKKAFFITNKLTSATASDMDIPCVGHTVIAADTIVVHNDEIIGKPTDSEDAFRILSLLRKNCHSVITGVCIIDLNDDGHINFKQCLYDTTFVYFTDYSDEELSSYVNTPEPYDKAGGYAIQETFKKYVHHIEGDFDNVVGFPWYRIAPFLK